jgi:hypothetical protein
VANLEKWFDRAGKANISGERDFDVPLRRRLVLSNQRLKAARSTLEALLDKPSK